MFRESLECARCLNPVDIDDQSHCPKCGIFLAEETVLDPSNPYEEIDAVFMGGLNLIQRAASEIPVGPSGAMYYH